VNTCHTLLICLQIKQTLRVVANNATIQRCFLADANHSFFLQAVHVALNLKVCLESFTPPLAARPVFGIPLALPPVWQRGPSHLDTRPTWTPSATDKHEQGVRVSGRSRQGLCHSFFALLLFLSGALAILNCRFCRGSLIFAGVILDHMFL
jgi:hypothetical protein